MYSARIKRDLRKMRDISVDDFAHKMGITADAAMLLLGWWYKPLKKALLPVTFYVGGAKHQEGE